MKYARGAAVIVRATRMVEADGLKDRGHTRLLGARVRSIISGRAHYIGVCEYGCVVPTRVEEWKRACSRWSSPRDVTRFRTSLALRRLLVIAPHACTRPPT